MRDSDLVSLSVVQLFHELLLSFSHCRVCLYFWVIRGLSSSSLNQVVHLSSLDVASMTCLQIGREVVHGDYLVIDIA